MSTHDALLIKGWKSKILHIGRSAHSPACDMRGPDTGFHSMGTIDVTNARRAIAGILKTGTPPAMLCVLCFTSRSRVAYTLAWAEAHPEDGDRSATRQKSDGKAGKTTTT